MAAKLETRVEALERATGQHTERVNVIRLVAAGEPRRPVTKIEHRGRVWRILPDETEPAFISRVRTDINDPDVVILI
jgi:SOS-response transcriptional repressor LexA